MDACSGRPSVSSGEAISIRDRPVRCHIKTKNAEHYMREREEGGQIFRGGDTRKKKGTDRRCRACLELVYESWAINRIVYSIVAATGF